MVNISDSMKVGIHRLSSMSLQSLNRARRMSSQFKWITFAPRTVSWWLSDLIGHSTGGITEASHVKSRLRSPVGLLLLAKKLFPYHISSAWIRQIQLH